MTRYKEAISTFLEALDQKHILQTITPIYSFHDDPKLFHYIATLQIPPPLSDGIPQSLYASGFSLSSREMALFKCLAESIERVGVVTYREDQLILATATQLIAEKNHVYALPKELRDTTIQWVTSMDLLVDTACLLPAQLVYINYNNKQEPILKAEVNTTGCAGGFDHENTLLRGIYECVERDAYLGVFLNSISPPRIDLGTHPRTHIRNLTSLCGRYNLELVVLDITNDLGIPTFMAMLIDKTGAGQAVTVGLKSHLDPESALTGSIEEAFNTRPGFRKHLYDKQNNTYDLPHTTIRSFSQRSLYWSSPKQLKDMLFLLQSTSTPWSYTIYKDPADVQLEHIKKIFRDKHFSVYYTNITPKEILSKYLVYKVYIPQLQGLYIKESAKQLDIVRLSQIAHFFGKPAYEPQQLPHIFL